VIKRANLMSLREAGKMFDIDLAWDELLVESGDAARWEAKGIARGEEKKAEEIARNLLKNGFSVEQTAVLSGMDVVKVEALEL
jgi:predicted transposase YdaD